MSKHVKSKTPVKTIMVRSVSLALAALMLLSVILAAIWQW